MIVRSLPYDISVLILKCISLKVLYVSIFPRFFISLIAFVFSKIQNKKPFVKRFNRKADYSLNQSIFFEKYITIARMINSPKLPANNAKVSSWIRTKMKIQSIANRPDMINDGFFFLVIPNIQPPTSIIVSAEDNKQAGLKPTCSEKERSRLQNSQRASPTNKYCKA